jgi:putative colanic acid biosynthesis acetyltransferase WcaF
LLLQLFGARIHPTAMIRGSARIWWPANLSMGAHASFGPGVICYNVAPITVAAFAIVSQRAHLCTGTHAIDDPDFPLVAKPIVIGQDAWVASEAFVGPGVTIGGGAVLGARAVAFRDLEADGVYVGNPAALRRHRNLRERCDTPRI